MQMIYFHSDTIGRGRGSVTIGYSIRLACRNLGDRIRATTDLKTTTGSVSFSAIRSATGVGVMGPRRLLLSTDISCHSWCGTLKNPLLNGHRCMPSIRQNLKPFTGNCEVTCD